MTKDDLQTVRDALLKWDAHYPSNAYNADALSIVDAYLADTLRIEQIKSAAESIYSENEMVLTLEDSIADLAGTPRPAHPAQDVEARVTAAYKQGLEDAEKLLRDEGDKRKAEWDSFLAEKNGQRGTSFHAIAYGYADSIRALTDTELNTLHDKLGGTPVHPTYNESKILKNAKT